MCTYNRILKKKKKKIGKNYNFLFFTKESLLFINKF